VVDIVNGREYGLHTPRLSRSTPPWRSLSEWEQKSRTGGLNSNGNVESMGVCPPVWNVYAGQLDLPEGIALRTIHAEK
jgi:hypothetical protein